jgi:hypothetical protein
VVLLTLLVSSKETKAAFVKERKEDRMTDESKILTTTLNDILLALFYTNVTSNYVINEHFNN